MIIKLSISLRICLSMFLLFTFFVCKSRAQTPADITNDSILARKDLIDIVLSLTKRNVSKTEVKGNKKVFFSLLPVSGVASEKGVAVSSINASFYLGNSENTNLSNVSFYPSTNFSSYFQFKIFPNLWLNRNKWNVPGKLEFSRMNQNNYGLGANTSDDSLNVIFFDLFSINLNINREILPDFFIGMGYSLDDYYNISEGWDKSYPSEFETYSIGTSGRALSSGIIFNFLFDNRKNSINPLQGFYSNLRFRINSPVLGSDYNWKSLYFDTRKYISFSKIRHRTLAFWGLYWATWGDVPYLNLPGNALDYSGWTGRGYRRARYRGRQMIYGETEYRFDLTKSGLFGGVLFVNAESFTEPDTKRFEYILPAAGFGCRLKFNKYSDSNITADIAFGKGSFNWYVGLNEAF
jgi:outer membrane protein assembly factor BamA